MKQHEYTANIFHESPLHFSHCTLDDTKAIAYAFTDFITTQPHCFSVLLSGTLGSGKSTFTKYCLEALHLLDDIQYFTSPSFNIINEYTIPDSSPLIQRHPQVKVLSPIYHIDLYRIQSEQELDNLGIFDIMQSHLCFIEWPEKIKNQFSPHSYQCSFEIVSETSRDIFLQSIQ